MRNLQQSVLILFIFIAFNFTAFSQREFGVKVSGGLSKITSSMELMNTTPSTPFVPSGQAGLYYHLSLSKKSSLGAELLFSQIAGKENYKWDFKDLGDYYGEGTLYCTIGRHISYFSLPVYYGLTYNKLTFNGGFQVSHALSSRYDQNKVFYIHNGVKENVDNPQTSKLYVRDYDFGPRVGIVYQLSDKLSIEGTYYYSLTDISYPKLAEAAWKIEQITLGLRCALKAKKEENSTASGQHQLGIKAGAGLSRITNSLNMENLSTQFVPSGQGGFYYKRTLGNGSSLGMELLFSQIEGKETWEGWELLFNSDERFEMVYVKNRLSRHISLLSLPVYYGINIKKLTIHAGVQSSYAIAYSSPYTSTGIRQGQPYRRKTISDNSVIDKFDFGPRAGIIYPLNDKLSVEATYYYGFNNILKDGSPADKLKVQQMTVGVRYALWRNSEIQ